MTTKKRPPTKSKLTGATANLPLVPPSDQVTKNHHLRLPRDPNKTEGRQLADLVTDGIAVNALTAMRFCTQEYGDQSVTEMVNSLEAGGKAINQGDLASLERMLTAQAISLNVMFAELARRASLNMGTHMDTTERYLRLALKAQAQSRVTVEALAEMKNPHPVAFVRQANIAHGNQQVNTVVSTSVSAESGLETKPRRTGAWESPIEQPELLEQDDGKWLDTRTQSAAGRADSNLEAMGALNRAAKP